MRNKKIVSFLFHVFGILVMCGLIQTVQAETVFNPNFLISDAELLQYNSMTRADIQAFLNENTGVLKSLMTEDKDGTIREAADIIYRSAQEHRINPKYMLVKLQKEQSLVTNPNPTQKQLDWATGYGVCDSCSMEDPKIQKYKGFGNQIDNAAGIMRWYYDNYENQTWIKRAQTEYQIDGQIITPANNATGFLYTYTPHIQGNKNFWVLWQKWFEQRYPNGSLIQGTEDTTVYLLQNDKKRPFTTMTALKTRFDPKMILTVPASELARYETGAPIAFPNYAILKNGNDYYLLDNETVRKFESYTLLQRMGYQPDEILDITANDLYAYSTGDMISANQKDVLGRIVKIKESNGMFFVKNQTYYPIYDTQLAKINFPNFEIESVNAAELNTMIEGKPILFKDGTIFGVTGSNKIYVVEYGKKRHIASEDVFNGLGFKWSNILWTNELVGMYHEDGQPIYLKQTGDTTPVIAQTPSKTVTSEQTSSVTGTTQQSTSTGSSVSVPTKDGMIRAPSSAYVGKEFTTPVDAYYVADYNNGSVLAGKNIDFVRPMASFTKVMTGYRLFTEGLNTEGFTIYNEKKHKSAYHNFRIAEGEIIKNQDLLYSLLISSINTPARMLTDQLATTETSFIERMNSQATAWGLNKTVFTDTYGYDLGNVSTPKEYATLFAHALQNQELMRILGMKNYSYLEKLDIDGKPKHYDDHSNLLVNKTTSFRILASKTGYLNESGSNLAMLVERKSDGKKFIIITMGNPDYQNRFAEPEKLTEWALMSF